MQLTVKLVLKEWQFSDGSHSLATARVSSQQSVNGSSNLLSKTGRKIKVTVLEGQDLIPKEKSGKPEPYVKLQYGKVRFCLIMKSSMVIHMTIIYRRFVVTLIVLQVLRRTRKADAVNLMWNQKFEFDEIGGGEYLKIKCYTEETFGDDNIGSARVNLEGLTEGLIRDIWVPLEKASSGEVRLQIEAVRTDDQEGSRVMLH